MKRFLFLLFIFSLFLGMASAELALPPSVTAIDDEAFLHDSSLEQVILPEGLLSIGARAFVDSSLKEVALPESLSYIADDAFDLDVVITAERDTYAFSWAVKNGFIALPESARLLYSDRWIAYGRNRAKYGVLFPDDSSAVGYILTYYVKDDQGIGKTETLEASRTELCVPEDGQIILPVAVTPDYRKHAVLFAKLTGVLSDGTVSKGTVCELKVVPHPDAIHTGGTIWNAENGTVTVEFSGMEDLPMEDGEKLLIFLNGELCDEMTLESVVLSDGENRTLGQLEEDDESAHVAFMLSETATEMPKVEIQKQVTFEGETYYGPKVNPGLADCHHVFCDWEEADAPTLLTEGTKMRTCLICGRVET